jgi:uncharacterized protein (TIGR00299 family) protein
LKVAYIHSIGGISGDMLLSSLVDLGLDLDDLKRELDNIGVVGFEFILSQADRNGVKGTHVDVKLDDHGKSVRSITDFVEIVKNSNLTEFVKNKSIEVFSLIGLAESKVHNVSLEEIHLHELGTVDTLVDVIGVIWGFEKLGFTKIFCSPLPIGSGTFKSSHGILPVPAPATAEIIRINRIPVYPPPANNPPTGELLTPTGTAIVSVLAEFSQPIIYIDKIGYGLGTRNPEFYPNVLSIWQGDLVEIDSSDGLLKMETNIDDSTGEIIGYVKEQLFTMGVKDVWVTAIQMKKNRPGVMLSVLLPSNLKSKVSDFLFNETSTLGIRIQTVDRIEAKRELLLFESSYGPINIKAKYLNGKMISCLPEYEDCRLIADKKHIPLTNILKIVEQEASEYFEKLYSV